MWHRGLTDLARGVAQLVFPNACLICDVPESEVDTFGTACATNVIARSRSIRGRRVRRCASSVGPTWRPGGLHSLPLDCHLVSPEPSGSDLMNRDCEKP